MDLCTAMLHGWSLYSHVTWVVSVQPCYMGGLCTAMLHGWSLYSHVTWVVSVQPRYMGGLCTAMLHGWSLYSHVTWVISVQPCYMDGLCTATLHICLLHWARTSANGGVPYCRGSTGHWGSCRSPSPAGGCSGQGTLGDILSCGVSQAGRGERNTFHCSGLVHRTG